MTWFGWFFEDDDAPAGTVGSVTQTTVGTGGPGGFNWGLWAAVGLLVAVVASKG